MLGRWSISTLAFAGTVLLWAAVLAWGQDAAAPAVRQVGPTILYYHDKDGVLRPAPNLSWEELSKALRQRSAEPTAEPAFSFTENNRLSGSVDGARATLDIHYEVEIHRSGLVEVPLNLAGTAVVESRLSGPGRHFLHYDETGGGYVALIRADEDKSRHRIQLKVLAPVAGTASESRLALDLPRVVPSRLTLKVPTPKAVGKPSPGAEILQTEHQGQNTTFTIVQPGGKFALAWSPTGQAAARPAATFETTGKILVRWRSPTQIAWDATFSISVLAGELSEVKVQIPPGARVPTQERPAQRIAAVEDVTAEIAGEQTPLTEVTIELDRPLAKGQSYDVRLVCERTLEPRPLSDEDRVEIGRFHVAGAARQSGVLGIITSEQWRADVAHGASWMPQLELPEGFREAGVLGSDTHRYAAPDTLSMRVTARQSRVIAAPQYVVQVGRDWLLLEARLAYRVVGARLSACRADLPGWNVERIELIENGEGRPIGFEANQTEPLEINLPQDMRGDFELRVYARQALDADSGEWEVALPRVAADDPLPAVVVVQPDDNVEAAIRAESSSGLARWETASPVELPARQQPPIVLREEGGQPARLAGHSRPRQREVTVHTETEIHVGRTSFRLVQQFDYHVLYEPLSSVLLEAPPQFGDMNVLEVAVGDDPASLAATGGAVYRIDLAQPRKGPLSVRIVAEQEFAELAPGVAAGLEIPTLRPAAEQAAIAGAAAQIRTAANVAVQSDDAAWEPVDSSAAVDAARLRLTSRTLPAEVQLSAEYAPPDRPVSTVVEKAWLQTWVSGERRQDRAVYQLRTNGDHVSLMLPAEIDARRLVLLVDGMATIPHVDSQRRIRVPLRIEAAEEPSPPVEFHRHVIECWWPDEGRMNWGRISLHPPRVVDAWTMKSYWHVVLPRHRMSLFSPPGMDAEMTASAWPWRRRPRLSQDELERWSGATPQASPDAAEPGGAYVQYLFGSVGSPAAASLSTASAATTLVLFSMGVLGIGMLFYYVQAARHPAVLGGCAVAVFYLAFVWPAAAVFAAQSAVLAVAIVLAAIVLQRIFQHRLPLVRRRPTGRRQPGWTPQRQRAGRSDSVLSAPPSTTATAAASLPISSHESP